MIKYPQLIEEDLFIEVGIKLIKEIGPEEYLTRLVGNLKRWLPENE
jgi:malonyl CoA-acyl carrier protein transacylase